MLGDLPPLCKFSVYTAFQANTVRRVAGEIRELLDRMIDGEGVVDAETFTLAGGKFWLWVLASFEVVRTMEANRMCFSDGAASRIKELKRELNAIRAPFAKQEHEGKRHLIGTDASPSDIDFERRDVGYRVGGRDVWMRTAMERFDALVESIGDQDVLHDMRDNPRRR